MLLAAIAAPATVALVVAALLVRVVRFRSATFTLHMYRHSYDGWQAF